MSDSDMESRQAILTVDLEDWYQTNDFNFPPESWRKFESRIQRNTERMLDLFDEYHARATFFILGCIAQENPGIVREIHRRGHEIACHGGWHRLLTSMTLDEIREDILFAKSTLEDIAGVEVSAFRAPSWSISATNLEVLLLLQDLGFKMDSSLQPFRTPLSGMKGIPWHPFHPTVRGQTLELLEIPPTLGAMFGLPIPFSGGLYLRTLPGWLGRALMRRVVLSDVSRGVSRPGMLYLHPWEMDVHQPRLSVSPLLRFTHYYNLKSTEPKVERFLSEFRWTTLSEGMDGRVCPAISIH